MSKKLSNERIVSARDKGFTSATYVAEIPGTGLSTNRWYDFHTRNWVVQVVDEEECQIGHATYSYTSAQAQKEVENRIKNPPKRTL